MTAIHTAPSSDHADGADLAERVVHKERRVPGEVGTWVFVLGDFLVFGVLFCVFLYYRGKDPALFDQSQSELHRSFGAINTVLLLTSSLCVVTAVEAVRRRQGRIARLMIALALGCAAIFLVNKGLEWGTLLSDGRKPATNDYFMYFFILTGLHAFHVMLGSLALCGVFVLSRRHELTKNQFAFVEGGACFWHLVDLVWVVLFALLYLMH